MERKCVYASDSPSKPGRSEQKKKGGRRKEKQRERNTKERPL